MKIIFITLISALLLTSTAANAGFNSAVITRIQMPSNSNFIYVFLDTAVPFDNCSAGHTTANRFIIRQATPPEVNNFDAIYAQLLIAQENQRPIDILSNSGSCFLNAQNPAGVPPYIDGPYIRFTNFGN